MTPELQTLLDRLDDDGVQLWVHQGRLRYRPADALARDQLATLRHNQDQIIALLEATDPVDGGSAPPGPLPLSHAQESMWFLHQLGMLGPAYNVRQVLRIAGALDVEALTRAFDEVVKRHAILRTRFTDVDGEAAQLVVAQDRARFDVVDLSNLTPDDASGRVEALIRAEGAREFELASECAFVVRLARLSETEHVLVLNVHHILFDGTSLDILLSELSAVYRAVCAGQPSLLPPLTAQYSDYARRQRRAAPAADQIDYWRRRLDGAPDSLDLPVDRVRPPVADYAGATVNFSLGPDLSLAVARTARRHGATQFMVLLATFHALLARWSGQMDVSVGIPVDGRDGAAQNLIGDFLNSLVIRTELSDRTTFPELLAEVQSRLIEAYDHRDVPFDRLVAELRPDRDMSRHPLFQVMFSYAVRGEPALGDLDVSFVDTDDGASKFDLSLFVVETPAGLQGSFEYATGLFDHATIEALAGRLVRLLETVLTGRDTPIYQMSLLSEAERGQLARWNDTDTEVEGAGTVHGLIGACAAAHPDRPAVVLDDSVLSYRELDARANQVAHRLRAHGVGTDATVAVCADRCPELIVGLLGVLKSGAAYVPLDPGYPSDRLEFMLADSGARVLLTAHGAATTLTGARTMRLDAAEEWAAWPTTDPAAPVAGDDPAYVIYTSGSTGRPKGAVNTHRAVVNQLDWLQRTYALQADDALLQKTPISFDVSVMELFWPLMAGARVVLAHPGRHGDPEHLCDVVTRHAITTVHFVPSMLAAFLSWVEVGNHSEPVARSLASLRRVLCSGEELGRELVTRFHASLSGELHNLYGPTEAAIHVSAWPCPPGETGPVPIGRPIQNVRLSILDQRLEPVPPGVSGHLHIGGVQLARGYHRRPSLTAAQFIPDPFGSPGSRLYRTGDLARFRADGAIEFLGRIDHQVKVRGFRVELGEIETALRRCPGVRDAVAVAHATADGDRRLVAYLAGDPELDRIAPARLREVVPDYMLPAAYVVLDELPVTANGKVDRRALPEPRIANPSTTFVAPQTEIERRLADALSELLGVERVGVHDNFFALGGHSLLAVQAVAQMTRLLQRDVPLRDFVLAPTIATVIQQQQYEIKGALEARAEGVL